MTEASLLWGEIPGTPETSIDLSPAEKEGLLKLSRPLPVDGPKFHAPITKVREMKVEPSSDPLVINTIQLLEYKRVLEKLLDTVSGYKVALANGTADKMPPLQPPPEMPNIVEPPSKSLIEDDLEEEEEAPSKCRVMQISGERARQLLESSVIKLAAHAGFGTARNSAVQLMTDATSQYLRQFCSLLRLEEDRRLEAAPDNSDGWSDALEAVCVAMRVSSRTLESQKHTVLALGEYYEDSVIKRHRDLAKEVRQMAAQYETGTSSWGGEDIPEMHLPSSEEGAGGDSYNFDHATPTLDVGMQMLQSLEAGGDLADTPMSGDSYNVGDNLETGMETPSPSPGGKKRRMDSGSRF